MYHAETKISTRESGVSPPCVDAPPQATVELVSLSTLPLTCGLPEFRGTQISNLGDFHDNHITSTRAERNSSVQTLDNEGCYLKPRDRSSNDQDVQSSLSIQDEATPKLNEMQVADRKQNPPHLPPPRESDISALNLEKNLFKQSQHSSEIRIRSSDEDQENCSPPGQSQYYLHPVDDVACTYLHDNSHQSRDLSAVSVAAFGDTKNGDKKRDDSLCLTDLSACRGRSNQCLLPENRHRVYENDAE